jgi:GntR family transcriptional regulator
MIRLDTIAPLCHSVTVTLLRFSLRPGSRPGDTIFDQVVFAAQKAFVSGEFAPGQPFPSVRALAAELKIHPNTAHKVVQHLIQEGYLEARPGLGTVVSQLPIPRAGDRKRLLTHEVEQLVVEARRVGLALPELMYAVETEWTKLDKPSSTNQARQTRGGQT